MKDVVDHQYHSKQEAQASGSFAVQEKERQARKAGWD
jgi:hypothetical protein